MPVVALRDRHLSQAVRWCALSVAWAMTVGVTALVAGFAAGAIALVGFGADSITDGFGIGCARVALSPRAIGEP